MTKQLLCFSNLTVRKGPQLSFDNMKKYCHTNIIILQKLLDFDSYRFID